VQRLEDRQRPGRLVPSSLHHHLRLELLVNLRFNSVEFAEMPLLWEKPGFSTFGV
jgi:hypothetical protein